MISWHPLLTLTEPRPEYNYRYCLEPVVLELALIRSCDLWGQFLDPGCAFHQSGYLTDGSLRTQYPEPCSPALE